MLDDDDIEELFHVEVTSVVRIQWCRLFETYKLNIF